ncbi:MAG TPA: ADP-ribosylglycohydrolase family protein [Gemmatimonadales bacterium]|nr:ADP-ribosylglycohydrolase family protein [Gemmatimonadales bacterium]
MRDTATALAGCLLGQALGDALGFVVEARPPEVALSYVEEYLRAGRAGGLAHPEFPFGQYSDDTQLARELVSSFVEAGGWHPDVFARRLAAVFADRRDVGAGPGTRAAAMRLSAGTPWTSSGTPAPYAGNGSAMRAAPLGILLRHRPGVMTAAAREQSAVTHLDSRCTAGSIAVAAAVSLAAAGDRVATGEFLGAVARLAETADRSVASAIRGLSGWAHLRPAEALRRFQAEGLDPGYTGEWQGISALVTPSLVWSLYSFVHAPDDYWAMVCTAIGAGGDTDTMAAIAGAIGGARLGPGALPAELLSRLTDRGSWGGEELAELSRQAARLVGG